MQLKVPKMTCCFGYFFVFLSLLMTGKYSLNHEHFFHYLHLFGV